MAGDIFGGGHDGNIAAVVQRLEQKARSTGYPTVAESNPKILTATAVSVISFTAIAGYPISQQLFGYLLDAGNDSRIINNIHVYSAADYNRAFMILPVAFIIGLIVSLFIRETYCKGH